MYLECEEVVSLMDLGTAGATIHSMYEVPNSVKTWKSLKALLACAEVLALSGNFLLCRTIDFVYVLS